MLNRREMLVWGTGRCRFGRTQCESRERLFFQCGV
jgi:hypothetical protein